MAHTLPSPIPARRPAVRYPAQRMLFTLPARSTVHLTPRRRAAIARARFVGVWSARLERNAGMIALSGAAAGLGILSGAAWQILSAI
jgi:hypothetical protein